VHTFPDYSLYNDNESSDDDDRKMSLFITTKFKTGCCLEKFADKLKQFRHPCILHYISWNVQSSLGCLTTERVSPLTSSNTSVFNHEESLCLGLHDVCQAMDFLHKAGVCHGNVSQGSIFISTDGRWRLGGLETVSQATEGALAKDVQALGLMVTELLANVKLESSIKFRDYAKTCLLLPDVRRIPSADIILQNAYFQQPLIKIFQFLINFPIKTSEERHVFLKSVTCQLKSLPPEVVAQHLLPLLLSRYVMLDSSSYAQDDLIPNLLVPQSTSVPDGLDPILPLELYQAYLVPQLKILFLIPDTTIRLTLLRISPHFVKHIPKETLQNSLLPLILLGMRDTDPRIVSDTLRCIAEIVPILGPEIVVGSNRSKIFHDRSPNKTRKHLLDEPKKFVSSKPIGKHETMNEPTKKEDEIEDNDEWDDWTEEHIEDCKDMNIENANEGQSKYFNEADLNMSEQREHTDYFSDPRRSVDIASNVEKILKNVQDLDIMKLDVKVSKVKSTKNEDATDYFADMMPNITKKSSALDEYEAKLSKLNDEKIDIFAVASENIESHEDGWGEDDEW